MRFFPATTWATAGGVFDPTISGVQTVNGLGSYAWSSAGMVSDIQNWLNSPSANFGWILKTPETTFPEAKEFGSRENATVSFRPTLVINYSFNGTCFATGVSLGTPATSDNCGVLSTTNNAPSQYPVGNTIITWSVADVNGNTNSCTQTVTVNDTQAPTITCPASVTVNANNGVCFATGVALVSPTTNDNCGVASANNNAPSQFNLGNTSVVWIVTDNSGNTSSCAQTVTVVDNQAPTITCPADITVNANTGVCFATGVALGSPATNDNCGVASSGNNAPSQFNAGNTSVVWTVTDNAGNTSSCTQTVTVVDNQAPTITCPADITVNANPGDCFATGVALGSPTTNDNCGVASTGNNAPSQFNAGNTSVVWTVTDNAGNTSSCTQTVTVVDNQAPTITCPADITVNANTGVCFATGVALVSPTTNDNCGVASANNNAPSQFNLGNTSVVWIVTDNSGNTSSCAQTVTVIDNQAPTITCPADITVNANPGVCFATGVALGSPTTNDNCGVASTGNNAPSQFNAGNTSVVWTVTDNAGNTSSCTQTVTVVDNQTPTITCPADITVNANPGDCFATGVALGSPITNDNCGVASTGNNAPSQYNLGNTSVVWTVTDNAGNTSSCTQTVTVIDNQAPTITCPADITVNANPGDCFATGVALGSPTTNDNCGVASTGNNAPSQFNAGNTSVVWTVTDNAGNTSSCTQTVTVIDNQAPTITCPADITVNANPGDCFATGVALGSPTTNDNCGVASTGNNAPSQYNLGNTSVVWTVTDNAGNTSSCTQTVTVIDNQAPTITCPADITVNANPGDCFATGVALGSPTTNDNCGVASTGNNAPSQYNLGNTSVVWTVTDNAGNTSSCTQTVTVIDNQAPTITCPADITVNANPGDCFATGVALGSPTTNDNCGVASTGNNAPSQFNAGNTSVVWTVTDNAGNTSSCTQTVTVIDNQAPTITCPADITVNANPGDCFATGVALGSPTTNDNCGVASTGNNAPSQYNLGNTSVVWTVTDNAGNTSSCTQTVTVIDNQAPTITCPADITVNANPGDCFATGVALGSPTTNDNCGVASTGNNAPSQFNAGNTSVVWTVTDNAGNTSSCTQTVTVVDNQAPTITCPADITVNANTGVCFATGVSLGSPVTNDNCGVASTGNNAPSQFNAGNTAVVWTVTDNAGNTSSCTQTVTVIDNQAPTINCPSAVSVSCNISQLPPYASLTEFTNAGGTAIDNCSINANSFTMLGQATDGNSCPETITRTYRVADASGNTASCAQTIIVHDLTPPVAICQNINVTLDNSGNANITAAMVNNGSTDNCGIASMNVSPSTFSCLNIGTNNVTFVVSDNCGNTNQCTAVVTVVSNISLVMTTVNVSCGTGTGSATATPSGGTPGYSYIWNNSQTTQTASGLLNGTYTVTVTDANGCTKTATAQVIVTPPLVVNCSSANALCFGTATGSATVVGSAGTPPYQYLWSNGQTTATAINLFAGTYTVVVTDFSNCTASCSSTLGQPAAISINGTVTDNVCRNAANGSVNITAFGGSGTFTSYLWSNGSTVEDAQNLAAGVYVVTATDNTGCTQTTSFTVGQPATLLTVNVSKTNVRCGGLATGSATASPTGGTSPYLYIWNNGSTDVTINNLPAGTYTVTVTDAIGCIKTKSLSITQNPPMLVVVAPTSTTTALATASGGVPPYTYLWKTVPNQTTATATGLVAGTTYKVKVNDSKGCSKITTFVMPIPKSGSQIKNPFTVRIYPNPSDGIVNMIFENASSNNYRIRLHDLVGKEIFAKEITVENNTVIFDFSKFPKGIYSLSVDDNESLQVLKVVLQ